MNNISKSWRLEIRKVKSLRTILKCISRKITTKNPSKWKPLSYLGILLISRSLSETHVLNFSFPALDFFGVPILMPLYPPPKEKKKRLSRPVPLSSASSSMASNNDRVRKMYTSWSCCSCNVWVGQLMGSFSFYDSTYIITKKNVCQSWIL